MNEIVSDLHPPVNAVDKWIATSAAAVGSVHHRAGQEMYSAMNRGRNCYLLARRRVAKEVKAASSAVSAHPYMSLLVGFGLGAMLGAIASSKSNTTPE